MARSAVWLAYGVVVAACVNGFNHFLTGGLVLSRDVMCYAMASTIRYGSGFRIWGTISYGGRERRSWYWSCV